MVVDEDERDGKEGADALLASPPCLPPPLPALAPGLAVVEMETDAGRPDEDVREKSDAARLPRPPPASATESEAKT
jgi:hypothetical protein